MPPGGDIFIHGTPGWLTAIGWDWTLGCIALAGVKLLSRRIAGA